MLNIFHIFNFFSIKKNHIIILSFNCLTHVINQAFSFIVFTFFQDWYYTNFISVPSKKAKFIKHIEEQTIQKYYTAQKLKTYITADQLIMAFAIQKSIAVKSDNVLTYVEMHGTHTRGQLVLDWMNHEKKPENVEFLKEIDFDCYKKMLISSVQPL